MPLYERLKANLLTSAKLAVDETPAPVLDPGRGKTKTGYFWAIARAMTRRSQPQLQMVN
jgi:transposase